MTPSSSSASGELWGCHFMPEELTVDVLMPNGLVIALSITRDSTLQMVKENLWNEAKRMPLFSILQGPSTYVFMVVNQDGKREEIYDERRRLCDLRMFWPVLCLLEPVGNLEEKSVNYLISQAVGRPVSEFDDSRDAELIKARMEYFTICQEVAKERERDLNRTLCRTYCDSVYVQAKKSSKREAATIPTHLLLCVWLPPDVIKDESSSRRNKLTMKVPLSSKPNDVITETLHRARKLENEGKPSTVYLISELAERYALKRPGRELYFLRDVELGDYVYIRQAAAQESVINMILTSRKALVDSLTGWTLLVPSFVKRQTPGRPREPVTFKDAVCMWNVQSNFRIKVIAAYNVNVTCDDFAYVKVGIFFGPERLSVHGTSAISCSNLRWNEVLEFDLPIYQIPLGAHVSFTLCAVRQKKQKDEHFPLGWINLRMIDYQDCLIHGKQSLYMWPFPKAFDGLFNPLGQLGPNTSMKRDVPCLHVEFGFTERHIQFPTADQRKMFANFFEKQRRHVKGRKGKSAFVQPFIPSSRLFRLRSLADNKRRSGPLPPITEITDYDKTFIFDELLRRDPLHEMLDSEREVVWRCRHFLQTIPESLPRLLDAVRWTNTADVCELYSLLHGWPTVNPMVAMELLDVRYPDNFVRHFAVQCLNKTLSDDQLAMYLMYLVQVLKYEPFLVGELGKVLLRRALLNGTIGHLFFWLLRVELGHNPSCTLFALLLEAYCRGVGVYLKSLVRQVNAVEKLTTLSAAVKESKEDPLKLLQERMRQPDYLEALQNLDCPLDHTLSLGELVVDECHVISSAKKPLLLVWRTAEAVAELRLPVEILFKMGDDLRQDMLTLQVLKIMDSIWKSDEMDFCLTPYTSLPMGKHIGMIEIVSNSKTILEIQSIEGRKGAFNIGSSGLLYRYIRNANKEEEYETAIERFIKSCAGYCVSTFVLGVGDRHPSNIMITSDGRIFHIDFGHFLGHYKKKLGISRERVPFVLTEDFLRIISRGSENAKKSKEFEAFQRLCGEAYLVLHRNARIFITLFTMMLCMGIPELQKLEDINYMRKTLAVDETDPDALKYFNEQLNKAYEGAWTTKIDWFFHSVKHM
ncbi:phosphatidylinositol 4,5 bisphosphate 3 kinase [Trichuris trichiura]|uniref:Phosphatidylinositol 4,5 bisphosphate 3 kinase n=1 Tax=Trichuris trichiura TaxID=36087 RepID=A0A077ZAT8_TRITR|nr:phosphatidylinositol 4,5 bisphosphate 3 kinase [Trichuris trichiura]